MSRVEEPICELLLLCLLLFINCFKKTSRCWIHFSPCCMFSKFRCYPGIQSCRQRSRRDDKRTSSTNRLRNNKQPSPADYHRMYIARLGAMNRLNGAETITVRSSVNPYSASMLKIIATRRTKRTARRIFFGRRCPSRQPVASRLQPIQCAQHCAHRREFDVRVHA